MLMSIEVTLKKFVLNVIKYVYITIMCGIFSIIKSNHIDKPSNNFTSSEKHQILNEFMKIKHRGPDNTTGIFLNHRHPNVNNICNKITEKNKFHNLNSNSDIFFGFHRLSINDLSENGNQPFSDEYNNILICNGEIYNYKELAHEYNIKLTSTSDCEIILHLFKKIGFTETIKLLDGVFACLLYDNRNNVVYAARDSIGIRPLYMGSNSNEYGFCSELKGISTLLSDIVQFTPGCIWNSVDKQFVKYHIIVDDTKKSLCNKMTIFELQNQIRNKLINSVKKRLLSDRPIGCLLSGGFDSSIISALLARELDKVGKKLQTFSVGLKDSTDLKYAKTVANYIKSDHYELILTESEMLSGLQDTIKQLETWDVTTIRAGTPMFLLAKHIKANFKTVVIMSGEAADESSGSYLYFKKLFDSISFQQESERLMNDLSYYDVLRVDKSISGAGLECRIPFIDNDFLAFYMNIDAKYKLHTFGCIEKYLLRSSFMNENLLPSNVLWRKKEAFSDGVSSVIRSWHSILQEFCNEQYSDDECTIRLNEIKQQSLDTKSLPYSKESLLYRDIFCKYYPNNVNIIPYYWVPKFMGDIMEPSARILNI
jgi:asparagine synthase (glutamine-hydrolysing)